MASDKSECDKSWPVTTVLAAGHLLQIEIANNLEQLQCNPTKRLRALSRRWLWDMGFGCWMAEIDVRAGDGEKRTARLA